MSNSILLENLKLEECKIWLFQNLLTILGRIKKYDNFQAKQNLKKMIDNVQNAIFCSC